MRGKQILLVVLISATTAFGSVWTYHKLVKGAPQVGSAQDGFPANYAGFFDGKSGITAESVDLTKAASASVPAVVHIKTRIPAKTQTSNIPRRRSNGFFDEWFEDFYGPNTMPEQKASGSGVIISEDGYIVTNNHVITNGGAGLADEITVTLHNRKTYKAKVIGRDPSSDIAVLKIDGNKFPFLVYGNSDAIQLGQWVLAIGYPLTLETTVTAGIVSATGRSININSRQTARGDTPVESFIQTDAAVNQGNSGGALVNTAGELIGVNSAILAPSGTYAGYSFAIPVRLIKKIVNDIIQFGDVQRGYLGINYVDIEKLSEEDKKQIGIGTVTDGVYVSGIASDGGATTAGIKKGDIITKVNGAVVNSGIQMSSQLANFRPGDKIPVTYIRSGKEYTTAITLKKRTDLVSTNIGSRIGAELATLDKAKARQYGIAGGVVVNKITEGGAVGRTRMQTSFIITSVNGQDVTSVEELSAILAQVNGPVQLEGIYPGYDGSYKYPLNLEE